MTVLSFRILPSLYLTVFQVAFIVLLLRFGRFNKKDSTNGDVGSLYSMFMDVHSMMFVGFGFLMTFLKKYGYSAVGFNFILAAFVLEWSLLVEGWIEMIKTENESHFTFSVHSLLVSDFTSASVLIAFGAVIGKATLSQLLVMGFFQVVFQRFNEYVCVNYLKAYDIGESIYVHVFGAYFGLAVAKILHHKDVESKDESSTYQSDLFSMIGTLFLWLYWPSFNSATATDEGQMRAIVNTYLAISASCVTTFIVSGLFSSHRFNMVHVQNATLAGGVAIGAVADMIILPGWAVIIGSFAGILSTLGFQFLTPLLKKVYLHDTCGVNNLHGMPGLLSGIASAIVAATADRDYFNGNRLYVFYPSRTPMFNSTEFNQYNLTIADDGMFKDGGLGRSATQQSGYQIAALCLTLSVACIGGVLVGFIMKLPIFGRIRKVNDMFHDELLWILPESEEKPVHLVDKTVKDTLELQSIC